MTLSRILFCCLLAGTQFASVASAQDRSASLPLEAQLNRYGLTLSWWGQAIVDPRKDAIKYVESDEQAVFVQAKSGIVTAFAGETGRKLWANLFGLPGMETFPASTNEELLLLSSGLNVYAIDKISGNMEWELELPGHPSASPEVDDNRAYIGMTDGSVYAHDLAKIDALFKEGMLPQWTLRTRVWRFKAPDYIVSPPVSSGDFVAFASESGYVFGVTAPDRKLKFQFQLDGKIVSALGRNSDKIFVADDNWRVYCLNQATGRIAWAIAGGAPIRKQIRVIGHQVLMTPHREGLVALSLASGIQQWQQPLATDFVAASDTKIYASDDQHNLLIMDRATGNVLGKLNLSAYPIRTSNDRTDRIILSSVGGVVINLREIASEYPVYHLFPDRRPILPEFGVDEESMPENADTSNGAN